MLDTVISNNNLEEFKKLVRRAIFLKKEEEGIFNAIPNDNWKKIFATNFDGNFEYARRMLLYKYKEIERIDIVQVDKEKNKIFNLDKATDFILKSIEQKEKVLFITDFDNDGSLAQAIINEYLEIDIEAAQNMVVEYAQTVNGNSNRGFTLDHVELIVENQVINQEDSFLIVTADNGINSREEQKKILDKYPNAKIVVTDHHNPEKDMVIEENDRSVIFNPHYNPTEFFKKFNISGAATVGVLLKNVLKKRFDKEFLESHELSKNFEKLSTLFKVSNLLDYVNTHPADKPEKNYIITKFLKLQPLMNINNSISKIITGEIPADVLNTIKEKIPQLDTDKIYEEAKNIHTQNNIAKILLKIYNNRKTYLSNESNEKNENGEFIESSVNYKSLSREDFYKVFLEEIKNIENYKDYTNINPNYIEQLRPLIFSLASDYDKTAFLDSLEEKMVGVFESIRNSEKIMLEELRKGEVITKVKLENSTIMFADPNILKMFNRKFLNKAYNDENPGFTLTLDSVTKDKVSGSFRSLYNISDILKDKAKLEKQLKIKIETPGHERAAGFIIKNKNKKSPITEATIEAINVFINDSIEKIKKNEIKNQNTYLLTDLNAINIIDRINIAVRGNVSNFEKITPILKIDKDMIWTDSYSTQQFSMEELVNSKKYGYISIHINFDGDSIIIPTELIRKIVEGNYKDYFSLGYMDNGVFIVDRVLNNQSASNIIDLRTGNNKTKELEKAWEEDFKDKSIIPLSREQIMDNPFFKYHDYGKLNFELFEKMVIGIIDTNNIDTLTIFDVEANGFGNSKLINIGSTNYYINENSGDKLEKSDFKKRLFRTSRKEDYLLNDEQINSLKEISVEEFEKTPINIRKVILIQYDDNFGVRYFLPEQAEKLLKKKILPYQPVRNYIEKDNEIIFNREIKADMLAFLVKDIDFKVPQEMINLTGITQELLNKYGKLTHEVDNELSNYYKDKKVLFGAHNTPYDARVARSNLPQFYEILKKNRIYDSALFAKEEKLAYDSPLITKIEKIEKIKKNLFFYNNRHSEFNLHAFIEKNENGYYPERNNNFLLEINNGEYYLVDKVQNEKIKINATKEEMLDSLVEISMPTNFTKYSVEKLSEQWMIHSLLLNDEDFNVKLVDLSNDKYKSLKPYADEIKFFQENYHFDISAKKNIENFINRYLEDVFGRLEDKNIDVNNLTSELTDLAVLVEDFLELNKEIVQKFTDSWMYKRVLEIKEPSRLEVNNDLVDLVHYQTAIPKDKIRTIYDETINFKNKYNISHVIQHEMHANGPWRTDVKGDIAFEDKLTLSLLAIKEYNPYSHDISKAINTFNNYQIKATLDFYQADELSSHIAEDSYSFRQSLMYNRDNKSNIIKTLQDKQLNLESEGKTVVKYKLGADILPDKTNVCCIVKEDKILTREVINEHREKLEFIMLNEQLNSSLHNAPGYAIDTLKEIYNANIPKILKYKEELAEYYTYVEFNRTNFNVKEFVAKAIDIAIFNNLPKREPKNPPIILKTAPTEEVIKVKELVTKLVDTASNLRDVEQDNVSKVMQMIEMRLSQHTQTGIEYAQKNQTKIENFTEVSEKSFLNEVDINRKKPLERLFEKHGNSNLFNGIVEEFVEYTIKEQNSKRKKI